MAELAADLDAIERGATPRAVTDRMGRSPGGPGTLTGVEARVSVGMGQPDMAIRKNRAPLFIGVGVAAALAAGAALMFSGGAKQDAGNANLVQPAPTAAAQPPVQAAAPVPVAVPAPVLARVIVSSVPPNAEVYVDDALVGNAPYTLTKPANDKQLRLELRVPGYENKLAVISALSSDTLLLTLTKKAVEAPRPASHAAAKPKPKADAPKEKAAGPAPKGRVQTEVLDPWD
jgi:hypothetical protein